MRDISAEKELFRQFFEDSRNTLTAMGDSNRQLIIRCLIEHCNEGGLRVGQIQESTHISRTAVSHHLKVLKDTGLVKAHREGTKNYYYLDSHSNSLAQTIAFWKQAEIMMSFCPLNRKEPL